MPKISLPLPHFRLTLFISISCCFFVPLANPWDEPQGAEHSSGWWSTPVPTQAELPALQSLKSSQMHPSTWAMSHLLSLAFP